MKNKGFTLIELLVVISIVGVLATVVLSSLSSARVKAQDAKRISIMKNLETALELYYLDNGDYPPDGSSWGADTYHGRDAGAAALEAYLSPYLTIDFTEEIFGPYWVGGDPYFGYATTAQDNFQKIK